jgi:hypothetical protein
MSPSLNQDQFQRAREIHRAINDLSGMDLFLPTSDWDLVERGLRLANEPRGLNQVEAMYTMMLFGSYGLPARAIAERGVDAQLQAQRWWSEIEPARAGFRDALDQVIASRPRARAALHSEIESAVDSLVAIPRLSWAGDQLESQVQVFAATPRAIAGYVLALLLDEKRRIGKSLRRCKLAECGNYFLSRAPQGGGRPPVYCSKACQGVVTALSSAERNARWRKRKAKKAK